MRHLKILSLLLICGYALPGCIFISGDYSEKTGLASTDTLHAYAPPADSVPVKVTVQLEAPVSKLSGTKNIDTRNVHPDAVVSFAESLIGTPYRYGSTDPKVGFDCSGFFTYVFTHFHIVVPRSSIDFTDVGHEIPVTEGRKGDLILFTGTDSTEKFVGHMGMIVSNENGLTSFIHSTSGKQYGVTITPLSSYYLSRYMKTIRIFPENE